MNRAEVKAKLLAKFEAALDAALNEQEKQGFLNLAQLENLLLPIRDQLGRDMMQAFIEGQDELTPQASKGSGKALVYKGKKKPL